jgi:rubrerythrin
MRWLTSCRDIRLAHEIQAQLAAAGIASEITTDSRAAVGFYMVQTEYVVWVDQLAAQTAVDAACRAVKENFGDSELAESRVSASEGRVRCRKCGYDLRGQRRDGKCPECGHPYRLVRQTRCKACNAVMESDFEMCWNCGQESDN